MKKQIKLMAVLSAAAVMTVAAPQMGNIAGTVGTAFAQTLGWVEEDGAWRYYDEESYYLTDAWKKNGNDWYYLNEEGEVAANTRVDEYYVNEAGKRVINTWVTMENDEEYDSPESPENFWFYFGKDGRAVTSKWLTLGDNYYYFDEDSRMVTGKAVIDGATYYMGTTDDGIMKTGWVQLENTTDDDPDSTEAWHFFEKNGKMVENQIDKKIDGSYFTFADGKMQTGWYQLPASESATPSDAASAATIAGYQYYEKETGKRAAGWKNIEGALGVSEEGELFNFYFKNGKPHYAEKGIQVFTIDSKKFSFNTKGEMQTGLKVVNLEDDAIANFYFGTDGVMKTGKQTIFDEDLGENQTWFFYTDGSRKGQGFHGVRDNSVFEYGLRKDADADLRFAPVTSGDSQYLVNTSGIIQKSASSSKSAAKPELGNGFKDVKDSNGKTWVVDGNGIIQ